ncbi:hypothetical protein HY385_02680, partial [Candidatus Daviesbacteria bacterium]|nr:hypothetical protein [Candidatus Daviesbacteria bacterium]
MPKIIKTDQASNGRVYWGKRQQIDQQFDLIYLQKESYDWFIKEGIGEIISSLNPVLDFTGKNWKLEFGDYTLGKPRFTPEESTIKGVSYDAPLRVKVTLTNLQTNREYKQEVFLG